MMLWYKAWRETRGRFIFSALALVVFCLAIVSLQGPMRGNRNVLPWMQQHSYSAHVYGYIYGTAKGMIFMLVLPFLSVGGLLREKLRGTASVTLALPVSRSRLVATHVGVGLSELAVLSLLPALLIPAISPLVNEAYPISQALHFSILWFICGSVIFATGFLFSVVFGGEYSAPLACIIALLVEDVLTGPWLTNYLYRWKISWISGEFGTMHWDPQRNQLLSGQLPWISLVTFSLITCGLLLLAFRITQRQDL